MASVPKHFRHVIVGGGVTGASIAYHLAKGLVAAPQSLNAEPNGDNFICVLDRATTGSGQTSRSAGIVLHQHKTPVGTALAKQTATDVFGDLAVHTDDIILEQPGSLNATTGVLNAHDFFVDPHSLVTSYLKRAKALVATSSLNPLSIQENTDVESIKSDKENGVVQLRTSSGAITADRVYIATGVWSSQFLQQTYWANIRSHYWEFTSSNSSFINPKYPKAPMYFAPGVYMKLSMNRRTVEIGIQEKNSFVVKKPPRHNSDGIGNDIDHEGSFGPTELLLEKQSIIEEYLGQNFLEIADMRAYISGLSTYTADGLPVIHSTLTHDTTEISSPSRIIACGGCNGYGITWVGGLGKLVANIGLNNINNNSDDNATPDMLSVLDARRFEGYTDEQITELAVAQRHNKFTKKNSDE